MQRNITTQPRILKTTKIWENGYLNIFDFACVELHMSLSDIGVKEAHMC